MKLKKIINSWINIFFADAKTTFERGMSICSALFWLWLEISFLKFFFGYAFGIAGYLIGGTFQYSVDTLLKNKELIDNLIVAIVLIITITRIPIYKNKEIKEEQTNAKRKRRKERRR